MSVPSVTRMGGPGICSGPPSTANALTMVPGSRSPSGCHSPDRASRWTVSVPPAIVPAARRLSLMVIRSAGGEAGAERSGALRTSATHKAAEVHATAAALPSKGVLRLRRNKLTLHLQLLGIPGNYTTAVVTRLAGQDAR